MITHPVNGTVGVPDMADMEGAPGITVTEPALGVVHVESDLIQR